MKTLGLIHRWWFDVSNTITDWPLIGKHKYLYWVVVDPQNKNHRLTVCRWAVLTDCSSSMMGFYWLMCFANLEQWAEESELHVMHLPGGFALASLGMGSIRQCALGRWSLSKKVTSRVRTWSSASTSIGLTHQFSHLMILISPVRISSSGKCKSFWLLDMMWLTRQRVPKDGAGILSDHGLVVLSSAIGILSSLFLL